MTREEKQKAIDAVERLNALKQFIGYDKDSDIVKATQKSLDMAIKALEQEPCEDAISRQAVEKITWEEPSYTDALNVLTEVRDKVRALPSVTPQPKTGHWVVDSATSSQIGIHGKKTFSYEVHCDKCDWKWAYATDQKDSIPSNYCPNCGAKISKCYL